MIIAYDDPSSFQFGQLDMPEKDRHLSVNIKPIIFSAPMVRALLDGRKTQTRRLVKNVPPMPSAADFVHQPRHERPYLDSYCGDRKTEKNPRGMSTQWAWWTVDDRPCALFKVPYVPGDLLWVRENLRQKGDFPVYAADDADVLVPSWTDGTTMLAPDWDYWKPICPSIHMPRWVSRITLEVTGVKVETLRDISEEDSVREGVYCFRKSEEDDRSPRDIFADLWRHLHGPKSWDQNPFVAAISFKAHRCNIDRMATP